MNKRKAMKKEIQHYDNEKPKPFKLCFVEKEVLGLSNIKIGKPLNTGPIISLKFYDSRSLNVDKQLEEKYLTLLQKAERVQKGPSPKTENQKYGWYQVSLTDSDRKDHRLYAHKKTNILIREHLMNYERIRD